MFDIAFSELLIIGVIALLVIGPERLPKVARTAGSWLGRLNRYVAQVKQDIDRDMQLEELRTLQAQMKETAQKYEILAQKVGDDVQKAGEEVQQEVSQMDKLMQAMAATDGGLSMKEYEKLKMERVPDEAPAATPSAADGDKDKPAEPALAAPATPQVSPVPPQPAEPASGNGNQKPSPARTEPAAFTSSLDEEVLADPVPGQEASPPGGTPSVKPAVNQAVTGNAEPKA